MKPLYVPLAGALILTAAFAPAQKLANMGSEGFGLSSSYAKLYDPATVTTFHGKITGVLVASPINGSGNSVRIVVKTKSGGSSLVEVGPQWFVNHQNVKLKTKQNVTVTGSKIMLDGRGSIMARKIVVGRKALVLRNAHGDPYWAANSPAFGPAFVMSPTDYTVGPANRSSAAQPMTNTAPTQTIPPTRIPVMPYNANQPVYMAPAYVSGTIDHFDDVNGNIFMTMNIAGVDKSVFLGPDWYIQRQDITLNPGDIITATILAPLGQPNSAAYAQSITDNGQTIFLRNNVGQSIWAPWFSYPSVAGYNP